MKRCIGCKTEGPVEEVSLELGERTYRIEVCADCKRCPIKTAEAFERVGVVVRA